ncbi:MAG: hypothetical protein H7A09_04335 [Oceanospirillaceae bacterium]|nr:hypothetical protein [Oceanospirillaceae bacterium]MCP5334860.1 hypothetical protein [Oceanospirillaceae bacterium]MCP5349531.1 hypothetical protein [Oceanospirillaceae bacterium]
MLSKLFGKKEQGIIGYIYVADSDEGILKNVSAGQTIKNKKKGPPWIVVGHGFENMTIAKWPGSLWRAEVIDEAKNTGLREYAKYTRADGVKIIEKLPLSVLFGGFGVAVLKIVESTSSIDLEKAEKLAGAFPDKALELYSKGWNIYGGTKNDQPPFYGRDHQNTIAMPGDEGCSPINSAFKIIYSQVFDRANKLTNGKAILTDGEGNLSLDDAWSKACNSFLCAAMAIAYQQKYSSDEVALLSRAWEAVYGKLPIKV